MTVNRSRQGLTTFASVILAHAILAPCLFAADAPRLATEVSGCEFDADLGKLRETIAALEKNLKDQEQDWPTRQEDQSQERSPPHQVRELQSSYAMLLQENERILGRLSACTSKDLEPLLSTLTRGDTPGVIDAMVPIAVKIGREDPRTMDALMALARKSSPCPMSLVNGLADLDHQDASLFLLELGLQSKDALILKAAGKTGEPAVVARLIDFAEGEDPTLAKEALRAITLLAPPSTHSEQKLEKLTDSRMEELGSKEPRVRAIVRLSARGEYDRKLEELVASRIGRVRSTDLKATLITYLGLFKNDDYVGFLCSMYKGSKDARVRLAVVGTLGNLGTKSGEFLLGELSNPENDIATRKDCVHSLGVCRYRLAARVLIDLLNDQQMKTDAARALHRLTGRDLGDKQALWMRWWRVQPEATPEEQDPEA